ncbi:hypothetical protein Taro_010556, partial [Colocasia esculenta]|nr:hypothetical protein [Colocasia esculenta]
GISGSIGRHDQIIENLANMSLPFLGFPGLVGGTADTTPTKYGDPTIGGKFPNAVGVVRASRERERERECKREVAGKEEARDLLLLFFLAWSAASKGATREGLPTAAASRSSNGNGGGGGEQGFLLWLWAKTAAAWSSNGGGE